MLGNSGYSNASLPLIVLVSAFLWPSLIQTVTYQ
jgi:hypothetical protein